MAMTTKELSKTADEWWKMREKRLALDKLAAEVKAKETALHETLINNLSKETTGISGKLVHVYVESDEMPKLVDRDKFMRWVVKNAAYEMVPATVNKAPFRERVEAGQKIPGLDSIFVPKLHYSKI